MFENIISLNGVSFILVFLEGVISFFSPCVIPLIPVYISYLAGNTRSEGEDGSISYSRKKVFLHTVCFVLGISFAFFILGMTFSALGTFFNRNQMIFTKAGGILILILGLFQLGVFDFKFLQRERRIHLPLSEKEVNPFIAFIMGFTFSFAWTPCVGPALSSVLILASGAKSSELGYLLVLLYTIGFIIPFLALGLFTTQALNFIKKNKKLVRYAIKTGGIILIIMGIMTFTGWMNGISGYLNNYGNSTGQEKIDSESKKDSKDIIVEDDDNTKEDTSSKEDQTDENVQEDENRLDKEKIPAIDFTLKDQYGKEHTLSDYKGKVVFLNFWASWCGPCREEMPHIEELYKEYNYNQEDVVIIGVANPRSNQYPNNADEDMATVKKFLEDEELTFPVVFDETGEVFQSYYINSFPTTFMIDKEGNVYGYAPGKLTKDIMENIINETMNSTK
ncbi:cytochrome c-type biogenesis protein [Mobilisporobacter senegalensis]|uniref:Cytochrome c-type biogenesis protein n=1 Tax=Mobilisporobacter senegalensis TaxID=1329262 RepID=A0A3N1XW30_9FIRM|nr:cytochrome c biogenesis protein/redoxin [Mobilisporobacter senegalensis]ROR30478.1 cytochrome c-type biogenesis protein [Mobilisporobacter senegalensis]